MTSRNLQAVGAATTTATTPRNLTESEREFNSMDKDGDGVISLEEFREHTREQHQREMRTPSRGMLGNKKGRAAMREIVIYIFFMITYSIATMRGLFNGDIYRFGANVKGQLTGVEFPYELVPNWAKTFDDIATVQEFYHWMQGPFSHTVFSQDTFVGETAEGAAREAPGNVLGYSSVIGGVRVAQLRSANHTCEAIPSELQRTPSAGGPYMCYGDSDGEYTRGTELKSDYGSFVAANGVKKKFAFTGSYITTNDALPEATDVNARRDRPFHSYVNGARSKGTRYYPDPGFDMVFDPTMTKEEAVKAIKQLEAGGYVDLHTRYIAVELQLYNPMLDHVMWVRHSIEISAAGGAVPYCDTEIVRLYAEHNAWDSFFFAMRIFVALFYAYYFFDELHELWKLGARQYFQDKTNWVMVLNLTIYIMQWVFEGIAMSERPSRLPEMSAQYVYLRPAVKAMRIAITLRALNTFLNWVKLYGFLVYAPRFAVLIDTLVMATPPVSAFAIGFFMIFFGFAQAHAMVFGPTIAAFRTIPDSLLACARQLLGDFAWYDDQTDSDMTVGPFFFLLFVCIAVLVVLNVLIAIVCDAYSDAKQVQEELNNEPVNFTRELTDFLCAVFKKPSRWFDEEWLNCEEGNPLSERRQSSKCPSEHGEDPPPLSASLTESSVALLNMVITMQATMADDERIAFSDALVDRCLGQIGALGMHSVPRSSGTTSIAPGTPQPPAPNVDHTDAPESSPSTHAGLPNVDTNDLVESVPVPATDLEAMLDDVDDVDQPAFAKDATQVAVDNVADTGNSEESSHNDGDNGDDDAGNNGDDGDKQQASGVQEQQREQKPNNTNTTTTTTEV